MKCLQQPKTKIDVEQPYEQQKGTEARNLWFLFPRHSGYTLVLTCYSWSLALCRENIKTDFNQMNDNLTEKSIQNALPFSSHSLALKSS